MPRHGRSYGCANGHVFDVAKAGYVNLLLPQHRRSKDPGYSKEMIVARRDFFDAGYYEPLADAIAEHIVSYLPEARDCVVVDAGCGEGYYLRRLRSRLSQQEGAERRTVLCGFDISKHGVRVAARRDPDGLYAVAGTYRMPLMPGRVDVLLTHFSPVSGDDFRRVVRPGGTVLVGGPGADHLYSFKELLYDVPAKHDAGPSLAGIVGFDLIDVHRIRYKLALHGQGAVAGLLAMTPYYWSANETTQARVAGLEGLDTEVDVVVHAYRRTHAETETHQPAEDT